MPPGPEPPPAVYDEDRPGDEAGGREKFTRFHVVSQGSGCLAFDLPWSLPNAITLLPETYTRPRCPAPFTPERKSLRPAPVPPSPPEQLPAASADRLPAAPNAVVIQRDHLRHVRHPRRAGP